MDSINVIHLGKIKYLKVGHMLCQKTNINKLNSIEIALCILQQWMEN